MLSKKLSRLILIGGIGALINSIMYISSSNDFDNVFFAPVFYFIHSFVTILAGYFLLKQKKTGVVFLIISFFLFVLALFIPEPGDSLFFTTIVLSMGGIIIPTLLFIPIFTGIFLFSVSRGAVVLFKKYVLKHKILK